MPTVRIDVLVSTTVLGLCVLAGSDHPHVSAGEPPAAANSQAARVETRLASALGLTGMTVNGSIQPRGLATTYYFECGVSPAYGAKTEPASLPPRLAAFYRESWDEGKGNWFSWGKFEHFKEGGASKGFIRCAEPSRDDHNHDESIGTVHLNKYFYLGRCNINRTSAYLGGGDPDLRDARVSLAVRGNAFAANGSELTWWTQSQSNVERMPDDFTLNPDYRHHNWAYSGFNLTDFLLSGKWERVEYRLRNDASVWTNAGSSQPRYTYWPIERAQRHLNYDFFHMLVCVDVKNPPTGSIDYDEFELDYRNHSLLIPSNGGQLNSSPKSGDQSSTLTDGWRHGPGRMWRSAENPSAPLEFVYAFKNPVTVESVQLHQHPEWPSKDVEVLVSGDGQTYAPLFAATLPEKGVPNANFAFLLKRGFSANARFLKVVLKSGYQPRHWGLGEIEVFGTGATMLPDDDINYVNTDVTGLKAGTTYHYRLVAMNSAGTQYGEDRTFHMPADTKPHVITGAASRISGNSAKVEGRLNPLGLGTQFYFEYGPDVNYGEKSVATYGGSMITPRTAFITLTGLKPGTTYHYRLVGTNATGTSFGEDATFRTGEILGSRLR